MNIFTTPNIIYKYPYLILIAINTNMAQKYNVELLEHTEQSNVDGSGEFMIIIVNFIFTIYLIISDICHH